MAVLHPGRQPNAVSTNNAKRTQRDHQLLEPLPHLELAALPPIPSIRQDQTTHDWSIHA
jgi:hypothetical protein